MTTPVFTITGEELAKLSFAAGYLAELAKDVRHEGVRVIGRDLEAIRQAALARFAEALGK